jgi:hypothetical protein
MGQDYPLTGPSPGANLPIYPSSLPRASGNLFSNISPIVKVYLQSRVMDFFFQRVLQNSISYKHFFQSSVEWGFGVGGGEELRRKSREGQQLSGSESSDQLILKMSSEHQTVDHRNEIMGNDHGTIFV